MHPGCFKSVLLLKDGVGDHKLLLSAKLQQQAPIVIAVTNTVSAKYSFPGIWILAHSSIEITKDYPLVVCRHALETAGELRVELDFSKGSAQRVRSYSLKSVAYQLFFRGRHMDIMQLEWPVERFSSLAVMTMKPMPERWFHCCRFPWPEEGVSGAMLLEGCLRLRSGPH